MATRTKNRVSIKQARKALSRPEPLWKGPKVDGVTFSLLSRFLVCRERFRLQYIAGLQPAPRFNHRTAYGDMWHVCEEAHAAKENWQTALQAYCHELAITYREQDQQVEHWYNVCKVQFPIYIWYWAKHSDVKNRKPLLQEQVFDVEYQLPSGRMVRLRGKWDSVDSIGKEGIYLQENKTKGDLNELLLKRQLTFDLQTMFYLIALREEATGGVSYEDSGPWYPSDIKGVRYNVVRRPLSGGKFSITQHKGRRSKTKGIVGAETSAQFYNRLAGLISDECKAAIKENRDSFFFMRWKVEVINSDITRFKQECLNPLLEQVYDWWEWLESSKFATSLNHSVWEQNSGAHLRMPYGVYSPLLDGRPTEMDEFLESGSELGLVKVDKLFKELD